MWICQFYLHVFGLWEEAGVEHANSPQLTLTTLVYLLLKIIKDRIRHLISHSVKTTSKPQAVMTTTFCEKPMNSSNQRIMVIRQIWSVVPPRSVFHFLIFAV